MKGRGGSSSAPTDLLVCFPSRAHLTLMPKRISSPSRPHPHPNEHHSKRHPAKPHSNRGRACPLSRAKDKHHISPGDFDDEPTSPKVTCAGQIKVRPRPRSTPRAGDTKDWLSVMEEIERLQERKKKPNWLEALGIKKEVTSFLGTLRFNMGCFGSFRGATIDYTTDDEDDEEEDDDNQGEEEGDSSNSAPKTIFSKWFMELEENDKKEVEEEGEGEEDEEGDGSSAPPPNALMLMRCRSAPAKGWLDVDGEDGAGGGGDETELRKTREEEEKERLVLMSYAPDFFKVSTDIAKETWVVGAVDPLVRCRSWKR